MKDAALALRAWLRQDGSALRSFIPFCASAGVFHSAMCAEKTARAYLKVGWGSEEIFVEAAKGRLCGDKSSEPSAAESDSALFG